MTRKARPGQSLVHSGFHNKLGFHIPSNVMPPRPPAVTSAEIGIGAIRTTMMRNDMLGESGIYQKLIHSCQRRLGITPYCTRQGTGEVAHIQ